jgi:hypothetical protein
MKRSVQNKTKEEEKLITFLARTKDGKYAPIEKSSLQHTRMKEETDTTETDEEYYYSVS